MWIKIVKRPNNVESVWESKFYLCKCRLAQTKLPALTLVYRRGVVNTLSLDFRYKASDSYDLGTRG